MKTMAPHLDSSTVEELGEGRGRQEPKLQVLHKVLPEVAKFLSPTFLAPARAQDRRTACRACLGGTGVRDPPRRAWAPISPTGASGPRRSGIDSHHPERRAWRPPPRSTRSPELTWRLAAASRAACGRGPGGTAGCASQAAAARLALHPPAAPRPPGGERRARTARVPRRRRRGAGRRDSGVGEGGRGRRRLLLHDCLPGCIVGV